MSWSTPFPSPIKLPRGRSLKTFRDAARYIERLPKGAHKRPEWQLAGRILIAAAEGRDFPLHAEIAVRKAIGGGFDR